MASIKKISGFPEWLPEEKRLESQLIDVIKRVYESYGFCPIETPAVELISTLSSKGFLEKEVFAVKRLRSEEQEDAELALHFDLTVPFARYVAQHATNLSFPFRRYQVQKVWRGERPQKGRFREFYQFDIDIIARDELPIACDAEALGAVCKALTEMAVPRFVTAINNRKVLNGFYRSLGLDEEQRKLTISAVDKINKIGVTGVEAELAKFLTGRSEIISKIVAFAGERGTPQTFVEIAARYQVDDALFHEGLSDLEGVLNLVPEQMLTSVSIDFSLARGLDYYTGLIAEILFPDYPEFGSVSGGGRYENLASDFTKDKLPGVGFSIGLTRLVDLILTNKLLPIPARSPAKVLLTVWSEAQRRRCTEIAEEFRRNGVATEVFYKSPKLGRQIEYAEAKGIPYVAFLDEAGTNLEIKNLETREQVIVDSIAEWSLKCLKS